MYLFFCFSFIDPSVYRTFEKDKICPDKLKSKNTKINDDNIEKKYSSLNNYEKINSDNNKIIKLQEIINHKQNKIENLKDVISDFKDFLKLNPDIKEFHNLKLQIIFGDQRIHELEDWIEKNSDVKIEKTKILELEKMVTSLEDYVKNHNVDMLQRKLQDREDKIVKLQNKIDNFEKNILQNEKMPITFVDELFIDDDNKIKELNNTKDKNNEIQQYKKQVNELQIEINYLTKNMEKMQNELTEYEAEDIGVLKEEIRVRDEKIQQLENEIESLEHAFSERIENLDHIEELVHMIKEKKERECQLVIELKNEREKNNQLTEVLRKNIKISSQEQNKLRSIEQSKRNALTQVSF